MSIWPHVPICIRLPCRDVYRITRNSVALSWINLGVLQRKETLAAGNCGFKRFHGSSITVRRNWLQLRSLQESLPRLPPFQTHHRELPFWRVIWVTQNEFSVFVSTHPWTRQHFRWNWSPQENTGQRNLQRAPDLSPRMALISDTRCVASSFAAGWLLFHSGPATRCLRLRSCSPTVPRTSRSLILSDTDRTIRYRNILG